MNRILLVWFLVFLFVTPLIVTPLLARQQIEDKSAIKADQLVPVNSQQRDRTAPGLDFVVTPQVITSANYYDYVPGANNGCPIDAQPEMIGGTIPGGGYYITYHGKESNSAIRRVYQSYVDASGNAYTPSTTTNTNIIEGYPTLAVDPETGNPIIAWHTDSDGDVPYEIMGTYDLYNVVGAPGLWTTPFTIVDNPLDEFLPYDDFNWPVIKIGPSPDPEKRRAHIYMNLYGGNSNYNSLYGYNDFYFDDVSFDMSFDGWNWTTFPIFDAWEDNDEKRAHKDIVVSRDDGKVAFIGYANDSLFCLLSQDYGETFETNMQEAKWPVFNPANADGDPSFVDEGDVPADIFFALSPNGGHFNATFVDNNSAIVFMSALGVYSELSMPAGSYWANPMTPKIFRYDVDSAEFSFTDIELTGVDANDDQPSIPWDTNEDGVVDGYTDAGEVEFENVWPSFFYSGDFGSAFDYAMFRVSKHEDIMLAVYSSGANAVMAYEEVDGYDDWFEEPEILVCVSLDKGETWSDPAKINGVQSSENFNSELEGMIPCYIYPTDTFKMIDDEHLELPIMFLDDNSYGSNSPNSQGLANGSSVMFAVLEVDISELAGVSDPSIPQLVSTLSQNSPNPFNPSTRIDFNLAESGNVSLEVFNVKGQLVKTLVNHRLVAGDHNVNWNGKDNNGLPVSSGVYFYKMKTATTNNLHKMLLLK